MAESTIKMNNQTLRELRTISQEEDFCFHYDLKKTDLIVLLSKQSI